MFLCLIFHISDFHNLKIVNNIFFFIFEGVLIFLSRSVHYWWDLVRLKQLSSDSVCHMQCLLDFLVISNSIYNIIPLPKKMYIDCSLGKNFEFDFFAASSSEKVRWIDLGYIFMSLLSQKNFVLKSGEDIKGKHFFSWD